MAELFDDETSLTEITIAPDGRLFVFGASCQVLEALNQLAFVDTFLEERSERLQRPEAGGPCEVRQNLKRDGRDGSLGREIQEPEK
jgi:hypothetical protein